MNAADMDIRPWTRWQDGVNLIVGAWFFIAPWVLGFASSHGAAAWNCWIVGALVFLISLWMLAMPAQAIGEWINAILGLWAFISPWVLGFWHVSRSSWDAWIVGVIVFVVAASVLVMMRGVSSLGRRMDNRVTG